MKRTELQTRLQLGTGEYLKENIIFQYTMMVASDIYYKKGFDLNLIHSKLRPLFKHSATMGRTTCHKGKGRQSVTSRLETSRYRDFSQFFESIGLGLKNFGLEKKSRCRFRKKVSVSVSKTFGLEKKSRYRSRKYLVSKKSLGIGLNEIFWSCHSVVKTRKVTESFY